MRWVTVTPVCVLLLIVGLAAAASATSTSGSDGRWKIGSDGSCYFDETDSGPDQCLPPGRWKLGDDGSCYFDAQDEGPNQCSPSESTSATESKAVTPSFPADQGRVAQLR
jgi:hypothetical protein